MRSSQSSPVKSLANFNFIPPSPTSSIIVTEDYVAWTVKYQKPNGKYTYGRTSNVDIAVMCEERGWSAEPGRKFKKSVREYILAARKEVDVDFDGGWEGDCTKGC
jgi:hypothetical protein